MITATLKLGFAGVVEKFGYRGPASAYYMCEVPWSRFGYFGAEAALFLYIIFHG